MRTQKKTYLIITVDTEADYIKKRIIPISKMVYGKVNGEYYGITKIMDICDKYNCKATFFVSTFESHILGEDGMKEVCRNIFRRGHDVQLHTHPKWITNKRFMWNHSLDEQTEMLRNGKEMIYKWTGEYPVAHRAGGFGADNNTLSALRVVGIPLDSSNIGSNYCKLPQHKFKSNSVQLSEEGIVELPVTRFTQFRMGPFQPEKPFDINANTLSELKFVISAAKNNNVKVITLLMHSFSFLNRNRERSKFAPNREDMEKFERLMKYIENDKDIQIITVKALFEKYSKNPQSFEMDEFLPVSGYLRSIIRAFRYIRKGRGNQLIVLSVVSFVLLFAVLTITFIAIIFQA